MEELTTRTLDARSMTPVRAYAALRAKAPGRTSYLLEMTAPDEGGEQRSVIGFLAKLEAAQPPAANALRDLAADAAKMPPADDRPEVAAACCGDALSVVMFDAVLAAQGVAPWPGEAFASREIRDVASIVFDHAAGTLTIAAANPNVVERVARTIEGAPPLADLPPARPGRLEHVTELPLEPAFSKQLRRAEQRLTFGGLERLLLGRTFSAPTRGADILDVFRALREVAPMRHHFFVELVATPMFPRFVAAGSARTAVRLAPSSDEAARSKELLELFQIEASCGAPAKEALAAWRDFAGPLGLRGGAIARARPGGSIDLLRVESHVTFEDEQLLTCGVAEVVPDRDAKDHTAAAESDAAGALAAIRLAHDSAAAGDPART